MGLLYGYIYNAESTDLTMYITYNLLIRGGMCGRVVYYMF